MKIEELLAKKDKLKSLNFKDGFEYFVVVHSYGSHWKNSFNNGIIAVDEAMKYNQHNGVAHIYTNNPNFSARLSEGNVYYLENLEELNIFEHPENAILMIKLKKLKKYFESVNKI